MRKNSSASGYCSLARKNCCITGVCLPALSLAIGAPPEKKSVVGRVDFVLGPGQHGCQALTRPIDHEQVARLGERAHAQRQRVVARPGGDAHAQWPRLQVQRDGWIEVLL